MAINETKDNRGHRSEQASRMRRVLFIATKIRLRLSYKFFTFLPQVAVVVLNKCQLHINILHTRMY